ncbi:thioredoxin H2 [Vicia villosa]|uniref:thioredoxin H2 n=1 Tax=Vicia villosa TaxID=3911 RepID=UPI00273A789F|nr:thioredoxin H2 [Vicia villosa]
MGSFFSSLLGADAAATTSQSSDQSVKTFHSSARWQLHFNEIKDSPKLVVIDFSATWCGPCKMMEPIVHAFANEFTDVEFIKIDVDELSDVAREFKVQAMPTFLLLKNGKEVDKIVGAKKDELKTKIQRHRA